MVVNPFGTMETLVMAIGIILIVEGAINLLSALYTVLAVRRFSKLHPETQSMLESLTGEDLNGDGVVAPDVTRTDAEASAVELDEVDESATVEQENKKNSIGASPSSPRVSLVTMFFSYREECNRILLGKATGEDRFPGQILPLGNVTAGDKEGADGTAGDKGNLAAPQALTERDTQINQTKEKEKMEKYDLIIVGAGPAGIFTAVEPLRRGSKKEDPSGGKGASRWKSGTAPRPRWATASTAAPPAPSPPAFPVQAPSRTAS